ncbi:MAG: tRNA uridine(34) 5-carboxymethylaminomethyl modification radical SAM/GNAT enzyme Elp3 [Candidatus Jacksonbacteria bacterium]|nr:tRNA uridine(34) 5-carboxymethylaminomethyl modification radical SAM/GNAT enzyme Elp3 [Candidatus Jacksonbacteria bacterium]
MIQDLLKESITTKDDLHKAKRKLSKKLGIHLPPNRELLKSYKELIKKQGLEPDPLFLHILKKRTVRTISGVAPVTVLTKPFPCPGRCVYCPTERGMPKSYLSNEPAAARALRSAFDPYRQVMVRLHSYYENGHKPEKIELIVLGGTWSFYPHAYQTWFIKRCFQAMNEFSFDHDIKKCTPKKSSWPQSMEQFHTTNQNALHRCVGLTLETRPDHITKEEIKRMRWLGATRVQIGIQSIFDDVLKITKRDQTRQQAKEATQLLKDAGFKINYHIMPNLPGSNLQKDDQMFKELFSHPDFHPDEMKIYPTVLPEFTPIMEKMYKDGTWKPYTDKELMSLLTKVKEKYVPYYVRISRLIRDIPATSIVAGSKISNLRQHIQMHMKKRGTLCKCIRCREERGRNIKTDYQKAKLFIDTIQTTGGTEYFISYENPQRTTLYAFLRLRLPEKKKSFIKELDGCALIRELHSYGQLKPILGQEVYTSQHLGFGKRLMNQAEIITKKKGYKKIAVIAGIGTREYYKKLGYALKKLYMIKSL